MVWSPGQNVSFAEGCDGRGVPRRGVESPAGYVSPGLGSCILLVLLVLMSGSCLRAAPNAKDTDLFEIAVVYTSAYEGFKSSLSFGHDCVVKCPVCWLMVG